MELEEKIRQKAYELGFSLCGFTSLAPIEHGPFFLWWLEKGYAAEMTYLAKEPVRRLHPQSYFPQAKSAICLGYPYHPPRLPPVNWQQELRGRIAAYALGEDYHHRVLQRLRTLIGFLQEWVPNLWSKPYVDTGPVLEREWAWRSGIGWFGKNTMLLSQREGSWFFLAEILVNVELGKGGGGREHCGRCSRCLSGCPTGALEPGYVLKAPLCISYLTIEYRGFIPRKLRPLMGNWIFGCDLCQEVCPWGQKFGRFSKEALDAFFPFLPELMGLDEEAFAARFRQSALWRAKRRGLLRNVAIALGNSGNPEAVPPLLKALEDPEPLIRGHAAWALGRLGGSLARGGLEKALGRESVPQVREEILGALGQDEAESSAS